MSYVSGFREGIAGWVHETARANPIDRMRHEAIIGGRILAAVTIAALVPPYLALRGAPALWETLVFLCAMLPPLSAVIMSRTGNLLVAQTISASGYLLAAITIAVGMGGLSGASLIWLALAPLEAVLAMSASLVIGVTAAAIVTLVGIATATASGLIPAQIYGGALLSTLFVLPAIVYAGAMAHSAMKQQERQQKFEQLGAARYDTLAGAMGELLLRHDRTGSVIFVSHESEALFGVSARDLAGRGLFERIFVQDRPAFLKSVSDAGDGTTTKLCVFRMRVASTPSEDGDYEEPVYRWVEMRSRRMMIDGRNATDEDGACIISIVRDVTREKLAEQVREEALAAADRANAWKDRFLANFSHELRTPLNAIIGFSEILSNESVMPDAASRRREYAGIINSSGHHLLSVVNAILDMSKIEAGRFDITAEPFEVGPLVASCCDMMKLKAEQGGIRLERECPENMPELVADKRACKQILLNLLSNALKFTPAEGLVKVSVRKDSKHIAIEVSDTGVGITPRDLPQLGDAFFQAGHTYDRAYEGTGLGLSVVRGLVGLHGGTIQVSSSLGEGTSVTVRLPFDCRAIANKRGAARIDVIQRPAQIETFGVRSMVKKIA